MARPCRTLLATRRERDHGDGSSVGVEQDGPKTAGIHIRALSNRPCTRLGIEGALKTASCVTSVNQHEFASMSSSVRHRAIFLSPHDAMGSPRRSAFDEQERLSSLSLGHVNLTRLTRRCKSKARHSQCSRSGDLDTGRPKSSKEYDTIIYIGQSIPTSCQLSTGLIRSLKTD